MTWLVTPLSLSPTSTEREIRNKPWKIFRTLKKIFVSHGPRREWLSQQDVCSKANIKMTPLGDNGNKTRSRLFQVVIL